MTRYHINIVLALLTSSVFLLTTPSYAAEAPSGKPIIIGVVAGESGWMRYLDYPGALAAKMAIEDINAAGGLLGRPLEWIIADSQSNPATAATAALTLLEEGAVFGLTPCTPDVAAPPAVTFGAKGVPSMTLCAADPELGANGFPPMTFNTAISTPTEASAAAQFAVEKQGWSKAYVLEDATLKYTQSWVENFKKHYEFFGGEISGAATFQNNDPTIGTQIAQMKNLKFDVIGMCSFPPGGPSAIRQIRAAGISAPIVLCAGMEGLDWLEAVPQLENAFVMTRANFLGKDPDPEINKFYDRFSKETGWELARSHAAEGYCAIQLYAEAVKRAGSVDGKAVTQAFEQFNDVECITGMTTFTPRWHMPFKRDIAIHEIRDQTFVFITKFVPETILLPE
jgi:branched-chain amino acid transport system substrate-binding protein